MSTDLYDALEELDPYYLDRDKRAPTGRIWALDKAIITLAAAGIVQIFKGAGSDPTGLTSYASTKLWLRDAGGVTTAPAEVRVYDGSGTASELASWPLLTAAGMAGLRRHLSVYSKAEVDTLVGGGVAITSNAVANDSGVTGATVTAALDALLTAVNAKVASSLLGQNSGVATLGSDGKLTAGQRPAESGMDIAGLATNVTPAISVDKIPIYDDSGAANGYITVADIFKALNSLSADSSPDQAADYLLAYDDSAAAAKKVLMSKIGAGRKTLWLPAGSFRAVTVGTRTAATTTTAIDSGTIDNTFPVLTFSATVDNNAQQAVVMPNSWDRQAVTYRVIYMNSATGTGDVLWSLSAGSCSTEESVNVSGTAVAIVSSKPSVAALSQITTAESSSLTIAGSPAAGDLILFNIARLATNGSDTFTQTVHLIGVLIYYTDATNTD